MLFPDGIGRAGSQVRAETKAAATLPCSRYRSSLCRAKPSSAVFPFLLSNFRELDCQFFVCFFLSLYARGVQLIGTRRPDPCFSFVSSLATYMRSTGVGWEVPPPLPTSLLSFPRMREGTDKAVRPQNQTTLSLILRLREGVPNNKTAHQAHTRASTRGPITPCWVDPYDTTSLLHCRQN